LTRHLQMVALLPWAFCTLTCVYQCCCSGGRGGGCLAGGEHARGGPPWRRCRAARASIARSPAPGVPRGRPPPAVAHGGCGSGRPPCWWRETDRGMMARRCTRHGDEFPHCCMRHSLICFLPCFQFCTISHAEYRSCSPIFFAKKLFFDI
jgi:hypothetical protein